TVRFATGSSRLARLILGKRRLTSPFRFRSHSLLRNKLDHGHPRIVAFTRDGLADSGVTAGPIGVERSDLVHQSVHDILVVNKPLDLPPIVLIPALGFRHQSLCDRLHTP